MGTEWGIIHPSLCISILSLGMHATYHAMLFYGKQLYAEHRKGVRNSMPK